MNLEKEKCIKIILSYSDIYSLWNLKNVSKSMNKWVYEEIMKRIESKNTKGASLTINEWLVLQNEKRFMRYICNMDISIGELTLLELYECQCSIEDLFYSLTPSLKTPKLLNKIVATRIMDSVYSIGKSHYGSDYEEY